MNLNDKIGFKVTNKAGATGSITKYDGHYITIDFGTRKVTHDNKAFIEGYLTFDDPVSQSEVEAEIREIAESKRIAEEEAAKAAEEADRRRKAAERGLKKLREREKRKKSTASLARTIMLNI